MKLVLTYCLESSIKTQLVYLTIKSSLKKQIDTYPFRI